MNENDYERLDSLIEVATTESSRNRDFDTCSTLSMVMRSRDCNFLECYDKYFKKTQKNN